MSAMKAGDMVQLIFACCMKGRTLIGWTGVVEEIIDPEKDARFQSPSACYCGYVTHGLHAGIDIQGYGYVPTSWLIKIEPPRIDTSALTEDSVPA